MAISSTLTLYRNNTEYFKESHNYKNKSDADAVWIILVVAWSKKNKSSKVEAGKEI